MKTLNVIAISVVIAFWVSAANGQILNTISARTDLQGIGTFSCFDQSSSSAVSCSPSTSQAGVTLYGYAFASVDPLGLHAEGSVASLSTIDAHANFAEAFARTQLGGVITFSGTLPSEAIAIITTTTEGSGGDPSRNLTFLTLHSGPTGPESQCSFSLAGECTAKFAFDPLKGLNIDMQLTADAICPIVLGLCTVDANYSDTSFLSSIIFTDASGTPLDLRFDLGSLPYRPLTSVPEPGTLALLVMALAGVGFARRRTRIQ